MNEKYSDWFKVDLHIHTDLSNQTKSNDYDGNFNIETLKSKLIENDVKLFSLTDHNIINTEAYERYYSNCREGDPVLLVGCEFDMRVQQNDDSFLTYHTLLIFNENTAEKAQELSKIIEDHFENEGTDIKDRSLTEDEIFELFHPYHFFYIPHAGGDKSIIQAYKGADIQKAQEMVLLMECAHEKVKEKHRQKQHEGFDQLKDPEFRNRNDEAFINFSDNHNCEIYPTTKNGTQHEFYYLKGEPSFETLRFAFIDPQSRIKKKEEVDKLTNVKKHISDLEIKGIDNIVPSTIAFSPNLNVIIGGASSGKSLLFNLIGKKIQSKKHDFDKYDKDERNVLIKASNSQTFQQSFPFNNDEIIYINQGEIVNYFEKGDLKDLIYDAGKDEDYAQAKQKLQDLKTVLVDELEAFKNKFDRLNTAYYKDFIISEGDFNNMLSDKFHFKEIEASHNSINLNEKEDFLKEMAENVTKFKEDEIFELTPDEISNIELFESLLKDKQQLIKRKNLVQQSRENFIEKVKGIINNKNSNLEASSRAKNEAFKRKSSLIRACNTLFNNAVEFNNSCETLYNFNCDQNEKIEVGEVATLVIELDNKNDLKKGLINCINDSKYGESIYHNYLLLLKNNSNLKDYDGYSEERLIRKIKREIEDILNNFDSPNTYLDYGENGDSKNKSPGFNAEMYLKTVLQQEKCTLVMIDQPEDNLGNTFKNEDLINLLREFKFLKQIILVTHNPSIVVYGDAENIILAENNEGQISYEQLVLENKDYQKMIIDNLDGGKVVFDMRSKKYNIKKLLNS
jgi:ABC-type lipoprotein export system ATPase subunit